MSKVTKLTADAIVCINKRILLIKRGKSPFEGKLAFPGGIVDYGEEPEKAALRELKEETSLEGSNPELVGVWGDK